MCSPSSPAGWAGMGEQLPGIHENHPRDSALLEDGCGEGEGMSMPSPSHSGQFPQWFGVGRDLGAHPWCCPTPATSRDISPMPGLSQPHPTHNPQSVSEVSGMWLELCHKIPQKFLFPYGESRQEFKGKQSLSLPAVLDFIIGFLEAPGV